MMIRRCVLAVAVAMVGFAAKAQQKSFVMPKNIGYTPGIVMVKVKAAFKEEFAGSASARVKSLPVKSMQPMVHPALAKKGAAWRGPLAAVPTIDIAQYFKVHYDESKDIESFINELYRTGYFEIVEPCYLRTTSFVTNDPSVSKQYYLTTIKAIQAWDQSKGDDVTIAIVDSGGNLTHEDLVGNLYVNTKDPVNGIDDDGDGFIDNHQGWDFVGADTLNLTNPNFTGDNDPSVKEGGDESHGTWVAGCASASTNNGKGIAGVGFNAKLMFTKHSADNQKITSGSVYLGYDGILYAANQGIKIINCSWGGPGASQIEQDIINHITLDLGCLLVAAAGNGGTSTPSYPGAYDNVLEVGATDANDKAATFTTYGPTVDISAPGVGIYTTGFNNIYQSESGTSFSTPITSGAAALVWSKNPTYTPQQVAQQLRISSDATALYTANPTLIGQLGYGRLDVNNALSADLPAVRAANAKFLNSSGLAVQPGELGLLTFDFTNYLKPTTSGFKIALTTTSPYVSPSEVDINPGTIGTNQTINNTVNPFRISIKSTVPENTTITFLLTYTDGNYKDTQSVVIIANPSFIDINSNQITTTITEIGRIGYQLQTSSGGSEGSGFIFNQQSIASEIGLMMGTSATNLYNNVRGVVKNSALTFDQDFSSTIKIKQITPGIRSYSEVSGEFSNSTTVSKQALVIDYRSLVWKDVPYDKFVIFEYKIKNPTATAISNFYFGMFADWDISAEGQLDAANWYPQEKMGYIYPAQPSALPYAGVQLLTGPPSYYALDNNTTTPASPFYVNDGFTDVEKFTTLSTQRLTAGMSTATGDDVSHVVSSGPYSIAAGQSITIAFALHAANNFEDLKTSSANADTLYNHTLKAAKPIADTVKICYNTTATVTASGAAKLKWYHTFTGGTSFFTGPQFVTAPLTSDTTFYVANADSSFESVRTAVAVSLKANPKIKTSGSPTICDGQLITLSVAKADSYLWSTNETTQSINVAEAGTFTVTVKDNTLGCTNTSSPITVVVNPSPVAGFTSSGTLIEGDPVQFTSTSSLDATSYEWVFGDGSTSTDKNPLHTYTTGADYNVTLTVTNDFGCPNTISEPLAIITGLERPQGTISVYPNPVRGQPLVVEFNENSGTIVRMNIISLFGSPLYQKELQATGLRTQHEISLKNLPDGIYILQINAGDHFVTKKIIKSEE